MQNDRSHLRLVEDRLEDVVSASRLKSGGGDGTSGEMEARVARLERLANDTRSTLDTIQRQLARIDAKLDNKPDIGKVFSAIFTVYGLSFTIIAAGAAALALLR